MNRSRLIVFGVLIALLFALAFASPALAAVGQEPPPGFDPTILRLLLMGVLGTGGIGAGVYWLFENIYVLANLDPRVKRIVAAPLLCLIGVTPPYLFAIWMGWTSLPETPQVWVNSILTLALAAFWVSQGAHGARYLKAYPTSTAPALDDY